MDLTILQEIGLSEAEAKLYVTLLELGQSKTGQLIYQSKLQSSTVYHVLGSLIKKGLVSFVHKGKIKYYQAESPESISVFLEEKKKRFNDILPELQEREQVGKVQKSAKVFQGVKGVQQAYNDIFIMLKPGEEYYFFQVPLHHIYREDINLFFRNFHLKRDATGIKIKGISFIETRKALSVIHKGLKYSQLRFTEEFFPLGLIIYKNKVVTLDWDQIPTAFVIESQTVADSYKRYFEQLWKRSKP